jgi:adenylate cyclase, class 1
VLDTDSMHIPTRKDQLKINRKFKAIAAQRLDLIQEALSARQQAFLELLPLLFHINHPLLPGYINAEVPAGIPGYQPTKTTIHQTKKLIKGYEHKKRAHRRFSIYSIFLMGSGGTVAYSKKSDFDIWLCHDPALGQPELNDLAKKSREIEKWAASLGLEVYFFSMNPDKFREGDNVQLSSESSGESQHYLLLEEFYRTGLWIAGRVPVWWYVPAEVEHNYNDYVAMLREKRFIDFDDVFDLGSMQEIPVSEFFSAAVWQLYKGIDAPYKSILKVMLMESYSNEYPSPDWLSRRYKKIIYESDQVDLKDVDPYIMLYRKLEEGFRQNDELHRLSLLQEAFYFKVGELLTGRSSQESRRIAMLMSLVQEWGWDKVMLHKMDARPQWKISQVKSEQKKISVEFSSTHKKLCTFVERYGCKVLLQSRDIKILGRKLYAAMSKRPGKIEAVSQGISGDMTESVITVAEGFSDTGQSYWALYSGEKTILLHRHRYLLSLLVWAKVNHVIGVSTKLHYQTQSQLVSHDSFYAILDVINKFFSQQQSFHAEIDDFVAPATCVKAGLLINIGAADLSEQPSKGEVMISGHADALSYGQVKNNLCVSFDSLTVSSWEEVYVKHYEGAKGLMAVLCEYIDQAMRVRGQLVDVECYSFTSIHGGTVARRVQQLFAEVKQVFTEKYNEPVWYILQVGRVCYVLYQNQGSYQYKRLGNAVAIQNFLGQPRMQYTHCVFDSYAMNDAPLRLLFQTNKPQVVQLFYFVIGASVEIYVLDEKGALFFQRAARQGTEKLIMQYDLFLRSVKGRCGLYEQTCQIELAYYEIEKDAAKGFYLVPQKVEGKSFKRFYDIRVAGEMVSDNVDYVVYCDEEEFSSLDYGEQLFEKASDYILARRAGGDNYPIYVTDVDLSPEMLGVDRQQIQTISYLVYKAKIEKLLNKSLIG